MAARILSDLGCPDGTELSLMIVGDRTIRTINRNYLGKDRATNVISFSLQEGEYGDVNPLALGDVVISADTAAHEAQESRQTFFERLTFLVMHGILHLCGYDHERSGEREARRMVRMEQRIFKRLQAEGLLTSQ
ncbi:MAG: rRNA maturation RNase YbeY [Desulfuromonadales bacterium]